MSDITVSPIIPYTSTAGCGPCRLCVRAGRGSESGPPWGLPSLPRWARHWNFPGRARGEVRGRERVGRDLDREGLVLGRTATAPIFWVYEGTPNSTKKSRGKRSGCILKCVTLPLCFATFWLPFSSINLKHALTFFPLSLQRGFQHIFARVPRTLCSVKSRGDVGRWPAANLGQVHSHKFQRRPLLPEPCQSCLCVVGGSVVLVFPKSLGFRGFKFYGVLNFL